jgi:hypothetical protein
MRGKAEASPASELRGEDMPGFICQREATGGAAQDGQSGFQEDAAPSAAKKGEDRGATDESDLLTEDRDRVGLRGPADRGSHRSLGWDPGGLTMGA